MNDHAATREEIILRIKCSGHAFIERAQWGAAQPLSVMNRDWDYSMIALHHAGRSYACSQGAAQMKRIQSRHMANGDFSDIGYHYGVACDGTILEGRDIRHQASSVELFNTGVIGVVLLDNLATAGEGADAVASVRQAFEYYGYTKPPIARGKQIDALLVLIDVLKYVFPISRLGGHREFPGQMNARKICPGHVGMELVRNIRIKTMLLPPPGSEMQ